MILTNDKEYRKIENVNRLLSCSARRILFTEEKARIFQFDKVKTRVYFYSLFISISGLDA